MSADITPRGRFSAEQYAQLLAAIKPERVLHTTGQSHVSQQDIRAHLTRIFGFEGWKKEILSIEQIFEDRIDRGNDRYGWTVSYRCRMRLTVYAPDGSVAKVSEDGATGTGTNQPQRGEAHDLAYKNAISYALKRCAIDLGDQFGLSLYNKGQTAALVRGSLMDPRITGPVGDVQEGVPQQVSMGDTEGGVDAETGEITSPQQVRQQQDHAAEGRTRHVASVQQRPAQNGQRPVRQSPGLPPVFPHVPCPQPPAGEATRNQMLNWMLAVAVWADDKYRDKNDQGRPTGKADVQVVSTAFAASVGQPLANAPALDIAAFAAHLEAQAVQSANGHTPTGVAA